MPATPATYPDGRMTPEAAAAYRGYTVKTLSIWRTRGVGPRFTKPSGRIFYYRRDLDEWLSRNRATSTSQARLQKEQAARTADDTAHANA